MEISSDINMNDMVHKEWIQTWKTSIFRVYQYPKHFTNLECKYQMTMQFIFTLSYSFLDTYIILQELKLRKTIQAYFQNYGYEQEQQYHTNLSFYIAYDKILQILLLELSLALERDRIRNSSDSGDNWTGPN